MNALVINCSPVRTGATAEDKVQARTGKPLQNQGFSHTSINTWEKL